MQCLTYRICPVLETPVERKTAVSGSISFQSASKDYFNVPESSYCEHLKMWLFTDTTSQHGVTQFLSKNNIGTKKKQLLWGSSFAFFRDVMICNSLVAVEYVLHVIHAARADFRIYCCFKPNLSY